MLDYVAKVSEEARSELINPALFERTFDLPLHLQIVDIVKNLNVIPGLKLKSWKRIPFGENAMVNKKHTKDKKIKNNSQLEKINNIRESWVDLLQFTFIKNINGEVSETTREMYCFRQDENHFYHINGKKVLPLNQIVDNTTYIKDTALNFRMPNFNYPIVINQDKMFVKNTDDKLISGRRFTVDVFNKKSNALLYFLAKFGLEKTIEFFKMDGIITVTPKEICKDTCMYVKISNDVYVEMQRTFHKKSQFISDFYLTLIDVLRPVIETKKVRKVLQFKEIDYIFGDLYNQEYWLETFAEMYSKRSIKVARNGLISFERLMDLAGQKKLTALKIHHRRDIYTVVRYLITNYDDLMLKDNFDLANKRIRNNEVIASFFDGYLRNNINSLLNSSDITSERIDKLLNTINHDSMFRATFKGKTSYDLFRYERFNDNSVVELSRFTMKGPGAISGGKYKTSMKYRSIYPSYLGRLDINICSSTDPGLTGYLSMNLKIHEGGRFSKRKDPDEFDPRIEQIRLGIKDDFIKSRKEIIRYYKHIDKNGMFEIKLKKRENFFNVRKKLKCYKRPDGITEIRFAPKTDNKGNILILPGRKMLHRIETKRGYYYDREGYLHFMYKPKMLERIERQKEYWKESSKKKK